jgi:adenylate cyclase
MDQLNVNTITRLLDEYLNEMSQITHRYGGTVDKYMGNGVMVLFGQSKDVSRDAVSCVKMALAMRDKLNELALGSQRFGRELHILIGIHSGFCTVGNFGSAARMEYTAVGSVVNRASRLEGCADTDEILISAATYKMVHKEISSKAKPPVMVKGIDTPIAIFSGLGHAKADSAGFVRLLK